MSRDFSDMIQESAKGSMILILGQMVATLISAIGTIIIARVLGSTSYGIVAIAQVPVSFSMLFLSNGVASALTNFIAEARHNNREEEIQSIVYAGFTINTLIGLLITIILYFSAGYLSNQVFRSPELIRLIQILSLSILAQSLMSTSMAVLVGFEGMERRSLVSIFYSLLKSIIGPILVYIGYGVVGAAAGTTLPTIITGALAILFVAFSLRRLPVSSTSIKSNVWRITRYAYPLYVSSLLSGSLTSVFRFILPLYVSVMMMGNYAASTSFSVLLTFFTVPLSTATLPLLSKLKPGEGGLGLVYQNIVKYESILVYPLASAVLALSDHMVLILYGSTYPLTPLYIRVLMLSYLFVGLGDGVSRVLLNSQGETQITFRSTLLFLIVGAPIGLLLIPRYGVLGFQFTLLFVPKLALLYQNHWIRQNYDIAIDYRMIFKILLSSMTGLGLCWILVGFLDLNPWIELLTGGITLMITYLAMILITGVLTQKNLDDIQKITDKNKLLEKTASPLVTLLKKFARQ